MTAELVDLRAAIRWFHPLWTERQAAVPTRLHVHEVEPESRLGSPKLSPKFLAHLAAAAHDVVTLTETRTCHHVRLADPYKVWECVDCQGGGTYEAERTYYRDPLARAFSRLASGRHVWPRGFIAPDRLILEFVARGYSIPVLAADLVVREAVLAQYALRAFRMLSEQYRDAPSTQRQVGWIDKSDAQRSAEMASAGTAA